MGLPADALAEQIAEQEKKIEEAEATFKAEVDKLQKKYESLSADKDEAIKAVKDSGLGLMKSVAAFSKASAGDEDKEEL